MICQGKKIYPDVKYILNESKIDILENNEVKILDLNSSQDVLRVKFRFDEYYFYRDNSSRDFFATSFNYGKSIVSISIHSKIVVCINGSIVYEDYARNLKYSNFRIYDGFCLIYFTGDRKFLLALKDEKCVCYGFIDECNEVQDELLYLERLKDSLNHGRVYRFNNQSIETYLVYLDEEDMAMKKELTGCVFLDCVKAGNLRYANSILSAEIRQDDCNQIRSFFGEFDYYFMIDNEKFILINKNTLSGIFTFEYSDNLITNITELK